MNISYKNTVDIKQKCFAIIERFPNEQLVNVADTLETMYKMLEEASDDAFCMKLYQSSFNAENDEPMPFEQFVNELGIITK